jgi:hypothetical protein
MGKRGKPTTFLPTVKGSFLLILCQVREWSGNKQYNPGLENRRFILVLMNVQTKTTGTVFFNQRTDHPRIGQIQVRHNFDELFLGLGDPRIVPLLLEHRRDGEPCKKNVNVRTNSFLHHNDELAT